MIHPTAAAMGADLGMDTGSMETVIQQAQDDNPMLLIGGYNIDCIIIATAAVARLEDGFQKSPAYNRPDDWSDTDRDKITKTVNEIMQVFSVHARMI